MIMSRDHYLLWPLGLSFPRSTGQIQLARCRQVNKCRLQIQLREAVAAVFVITLANADVFSWLVGTVTLGQRRLTEFPTSKFFYA